LSTTKNIFRYFDERHHRQKQYFGLCCTFYRVEFDSRTQLKGIKSNYGINKSKERQNLQSMEWFSWLLSTSQRTWSHRMCNNKIVGRIKSYENDKSSKRKKRRRFGAGKESILITCYHKCKLKTKLVYQ
jgi:hypothetical protein